MNAIFRGLFSFAVGTFLDASIVHDAEVSDAPDVVWFLVNGAVNPEGLITPVPDVIIHPLSVSNSPVIFLLHHPEQIIKLGHYLHLYRYQNHE